MGGVCAGGAKASKAVEQAESCGRQGYNQMQAKPLDSSVKKGNGTSGEEVAEFQRTAFPRNYHNFIDHNTGGGGLVPLSFSRELKPSSAARIAPPKDNHRSSLIGKAASVGLEKAVEVLDTLGSSMSSLNPRSGFVHGLSSRGNIISILAFEVANTISKGASLFQSLSVKNVEFVKNEILLSCGVRELVSTDMEELTMIAAMDKREEFDVFTKEVVRFGDLCKDPQWHFLGRYFAKLDTENSIDRPTRAEADSTMLYFNTLVQHTSELYHELHALDRFEQDYKRRRDEVLSLQLSQKGSLVILHSELKDQRKLVRSLKKKSLWHKTLEEIMEKLVDIVAYLHQAIVDAFGHPGTKPEIEEGVKKPTRLGVAGLSLHYANVVSQIDSIVSRPTSLPPNVRDALYHGLPAAVKTAMRSKANFIADNQELSVAEVKAEIEKKMRWLLPMATNTTRAHQGFGWVGEWANNGTEYGMSSTSQVSIIRLQTLYHADKEKLEHHILEVMTWLQRLIHIIRQRDHSLSPLPAKSTQKEQTRGANTEIKAVQNMSLSEEEKDLLARVRSKRLSPGVSKSQEFHVANRRRVWALSRSTGNSPAVDKSRCRRADTPKETNVLDIMDGLVA